MPGPADGERRRSGYPLQFGVWSLILVAATLVLVLFVLPQRFVLSSGFRESGISFPVTRPPVPPLPVTQRTAPPRPPKRVVEDTATYRGPAEILWSRTGPLMEAGRYDEAAALMGAYLAERPGDRDVQRELINALLAAGRADEAVDQLRGYLRSGEDTEARLLLARTLRDMGRMEAASAQYALLREEGVEGSDLSLEWARALAWAELYSESAEVLVIALDADPGNAALQVELARVLYYQGRLAEADAVLAGLSDSELDAQGARGLRDEVTAALAVPVVEPEPAPSLVELAARARAEGDPVRSEELLRQALAADPDDLAAWVALADLLQYETGDMQGALGALREVEARTSYDPSLQYRMAQLEIWTGQETEASDRLDGVLAALRASGPVPLAGDPQGRMLTAPDVLALQGDLRRWSGDRIPAAEDYQAALAEDPEHEPAAAGLAELREDVDRSIEEAEGPRLGAYAYGLGDTDEYRRLDVAAEWVGVRGDWTWSVAGGHRWLEGFDPTASPAKASGLFAEFQGARWWRWGTIRTGLHLGVENVREGGTDLSFGASARFTELGRFTLDGRYRHGLAYDQTATLQSVFAEVVQDHFMVSLNGDLTPVWTLWAEAQAARLATRGVPGADPSTRLQASLSLGRRLTQSLTLGLSGTVLGYSAEAPLANVRPLFWDPEMVISVGPFARYDRQVDERWDLSARLSPAMALLHERRAAEREWLPHFSSEAGIRHRGDHLWTSLDLFFAQGRFDGYRTWGARLSVSVRNLPWLGGGP